MKKNVKGMGLYALILLLLATIAVYAVSQMGAPSKVGFSEAYQHLNAGEVRKMSVRGTMVTMILSDGSSVSSELGQYANLFLQIAKDDMAEQMQQKSLNFNVENSQWDSVGPILVNLLIVGLGIWLLFTLMSKQGGGGGNAMQFSKTRAKLADDKRKVQFKDVAGADEEKAELEEVVEFLKNPKKFVEIGARIPKGVLLVGPPGTGKTLIARAVAGEAGVPFFSVSGSDFVELYVGVGASRVRDLFEQAKKNAPAIVFIDEIDAVGRQRGAGLGGGHDEREQTLNQLLVEMDGFGANEGVIVIAATNRKDILDKALLRPGRFDRQVYVGVPDVKGREAILKVHAHNKQIDPDIKFDAVARSTAGFTGADLENLLNEAALLAARREKKIVTQDEIEDSLLKVVMGTEKKTHVINEKDKKLTAYHEAGHAICFEVLDTQDPVHHVTIIPRSNGAGGFTMPRPEEDKAYRTKGYMEDHIVVCLAGRIAESMFMEDISTGAYSDIKQATQIARAMVTTYGMSEKIGMIDYGTDNGGEVFLGRELGAAKGYSEQMAAQIDEEVHRLIDEGYQKCEKILVQYTPQMIAIAEYLLEHETMDGPTFKKVFQQAGQSGSEREDTVSSVAAEPEDV